MTTNLLQSSRDAWSSWTPMPSLSPVFAAENGHMSLSGNGNRHAFGAWTQRVPAEPGKAYHLRAAFRCEGVGDMLLHVTPQVVWRRGDMAEANCAVDAIRRFRQEGDLIVGEDVFIAPGNCDGAEVRLLLRYAPAAVVRFEEVSLTETDRPKPRRVRVGTMRFRPPGGSGPADHLRLYGEQIDRLGVTGSDMILLPEFANTASLPPRQGLDLWEFAELIPGPFCAMVSEKARAYRSYICAGLLERDGDFIFNAAVLYDRDGKLIGKQRKVHPYWPEEPLGVSPGDSFDVFETDFGTVGIMICYDSWWPESARLLALRGAELILFPNAGYEEKILPARAIDNNVYILASTLNSPAAVVTPRGDLLTVSAVNNTLTAEIDLNDRPKCHPNAGGNMNPGPGGARWARNANSPRIYEEILAEVQRGVEA